MRAPSRSFGTELEVYREKLIADNKEHPDLPLWLKVLDRWRRHTAAEQIWQTLKNKVPAGDMLTEEEFIWLVLEQRLIVLEPLIKVVDGLPGKKQLVDHRTKRHMKEKKHTQIALENELLGRALDQSDRLLGREKKTAIRNRFVAAWSGKFTQICGQPLDEVVRVLTEIAFGKTMTIDSVRGVRKVLP